MRWAEHVAHNKLEMRTQFWLKNQKGSDYSEYLGVDEKVVL